MFPLAAVGEDDHGAGGILLFAVSQHFQTTLVGQIQVEEDHLRTPQGKQPQRLRRRGGDAHDLDFRGVPQEHLETLADDRRVIHDQDSDASLSAEFHGMFPKMLLPGIVRVAPWRRAKVSVRNRGADAGAGPTSNDRAGARFTMATSQAGAMNGRMASRALFGFVLTGSR